MSLLFGNLGEVDWVEMMSLSMMNPHLLVQTLTAAVIGVMLIAVVTSE